MSNLWKVLMFVWDNKEIIWKVIQEIMDLFKENEENATVMGRIHHDCLDPSPKLTALTRLGSEAGHYNRKNKNQN